MPRRAHAPSPDWLLLAEAAQVLGISIDTARRRVRRGELDAVRVPGPHGTAWYVRLPAHARIGTPDGESDAQARPGMPMVIEASIEPTVQALLVYLRERDQQRDREVAELRTELAQARADLIEHAAELAEARERLRALAAPTEPDAAPDCTGADSDGGTAEHPDIPGAPRGTLAPPLQHPDRGRSAANARKGWRCWGGPRAQGGLTRHTVQTRRRLGGSSRRRL